MRGMSPYDPSRSSHRYLRRVIDGAVTRHLPVSVDGSNRRPDRYRHFRIRIRRLD